MGKTACTAMNHLSLDEFGRPKNPRSIYLKVKKKVANSIDYENCLTGGSTIVLPARWLQQDFFIEGKIAKIVQFPIGKLVYLESSFAGGRWSSLDTKQMRLLWLPNVGDCGFI